MFNNNERDKMIKGEKHIELGRKDGLDFRKEYYGLDFQFNDGGRKFAGYKGFTGDCVCRATAIATGISYQTLYDELTVRTKEWRINSNSRQAYLAKPKDDSPRQGVPMKVLRTYLKDHGWTWVPKMFIGSGCKFHLRQGELPINKALIVQVSGHITAVINGVLNDTYDCSRNATRCVYGYYYKE